MALEVPSGTHTVSTEPSSPCLISRPRSAAPSTAESASKPSVLGGTREAHNASVPTEVASPLCGAEAKAVFSPRAMPAPAFAARQGPTGPYQHLQHTNTAGASSGSLPGSRRRHGKHLGRKGASEVFESVDPATAPTALSSSFLASSPPSHENAYALVGGPLSPGNGGGGGSSSPQRGTRFEPYGRTAPRPPSRLDEGLSAPFSNMRVSSPLTALPMRSSSGSALAPAARPTGRDLASDGEEEERSPVGAVATRFSPAGRAGRSLSSALMSRVSVQKPADVDEFQELVANMSPHDLGLKRYPRVYAQPPLDWSLKHSISLKSTASFDWARDVSAHASARGLSSFVRDSDHAAGDSFANVEAASEALQQALLYWRHPSADLPEDLRNMGRAACDKAPALRVRSDIMLADMFETRRDEWQTAFQSLFGLYRRGFCSYFYHCSPDATVLFQRFSMVDRDGGAGASSHELRALVSSSTLGFRASLQTQHVPFTMIFGASDDGLLSGDASEDASSLFVAGTEGVTALYNYLLNFKQHRRTDTLLPVLLAPTAFAHASLKSLHVTPSGTVTCLRDGVRESVFCAEISGGVLLPGAVRLLLNALVSTQTGQFAATLHSQPGSSSLNVSAPPGAHGVVLASGDVRPVDCRYFSAIECKDGSFIV